MKVFNIKPLACDVTLVEILQGVMLFFLPDFACIAALFLFPSIALVLVHTFHG